MKLQLTAFILLIVCIHPNLIGQESLELDGAVRISNTTAASPDPGTLRWTGSDYEGRMDGSWKSLTKSGQISTNQVVDVDGNVYNTITIGTQVWLRENLRTSRYSDGTSIPEKNMNTDWINPSPAVSSYENNRKLDDVQGKVYNWYAMDLASTGGRNVCPSGWHVPFNHEVITMNTFLGSNAADKMREVGNASWSFGNEDATNESGFTGLQAGVRFEDGNFRDLLVAAFWTQSEDSIEDGRSFILNDTHIIDFSHSPKESGFGVRCIQD